MKEEHRTSQRKPGEPMPEDALQVLRGFRDHLNTTDLSTTEFAIGMHAVQGPHEGAYQSMGMMLGSPPQLMSGLVEMAGQALSGHPKMQQIFLIMLLAKFNELKGAPPADPHDLDAQAAGLSDKLKELFK